MAGDTTLPDAAQAYIGERTDGVPLYIEELTRAVLAIPGLDLQGPPATVRDALGALAIPSTLQDTLESRLDRLGEARELAQVAAVLGRDFGADLLTRVAEAEGLELDTGLARLVSGELLQRRGLGKRTRYQFKHALAQEAAYGSLPDARRQALHERVGAVLQAHFPALVERAPELVAHHLTEAGRADVALRYWLEAGRRSLAASAHAEAVAHFRATLAQADAAAPAPALRLDILLGLASALAVTQGHGADEVRSLYDEALVLARAHGDGDRLFQALRGVWQVHSSAGDVAMARALGDELVGIADRSGDLLVRLEAYRMLGNNEFWTGEFVAARQHLEAAGELHARVERGQRLHRHEQDPLVANRALLTWVLCLLGEPRAALAHLDAALGRARGLDHAFSHAFALGGAMWAHRFLEQPDLARAWAEQCLAVCLERGFAYLEVAARLVRAWAECAIEPGPAHTDDMGRRIDEWRGRGSHVGAASFTVLRADALLRTGEGDAAVGLLADDVLVERIGSERWLRSEWNRLRGRAELVRGGDLALAEQHLRTASEAARAQGARTLQLGALIAQVELYRHHGLCEDAPGELRAVLDTFVDAADCGIVRAAAAALTDIPH